MKLNRTIHFQRLPGILCHDNGNKSRLLTITLGSPSHCFLAKVIHTGMKWKRHSLLLSIIHINSLCQPSWYIKWYCSFNIKTVTLRRGVFTCSPWVRVLFLSKFQGSSVQSSKTCLLHRADLPRSSSWTLLTSNAILIITFYIVVL